MTDLSRVVWSEGMFLRPHHFQQQERFILQEAVQVTRSVSPYIWGVKQLDIDEALLSHSQFGIASISALMPDGSGIESPSRDMLPTAIEIEQGIRDEIVYLAIPLEKVGAINISEKNSHKITRFTFADHEVADINVGTDSLEVLQLAQLTPELKLSRDSLSGYITLPIARVIEVTEEGKVLIDNKFIPPCLNVNNNSVTRSLLSELCGMLKLRADALAARLSQGQGVANSIADFMMLQLLNRYEPLFVHLAKVDGLHPQVLCQHLFSLVGELATFSDANKRPPKMPVYQHEGLANVFSQIMSALNKYMSTVLEQSATQLTMDVTKFGIRVAAIPDKAILGHSTFVIAVKANIHGEELRRRFPAQVKIGPVEQIRDLVNNQLPGIAVTALPVAPRQIPYHADYFYFKLTKNSDYWQRLTTSGGIAFICQGNTQNSICSYGP